MPSLSTCIWFNNTAEEAVKLYTSLFRGGKIGAESRYDKASAEVSGQPEGSLLTVEFEILGATFTALNGGPLFKLNPSISFMVNFDPSQDKDAAKNIDRVWNTLIDGGQALMELGEYPFSKRYGWVQDKFGVSWQLILTDPKGENRPLVLPSLLFVNEVYGKAEEARKLYLSVFKNSKEGAIARYPAGMPNDKEGTVMFSDFRLENLWFVAMDSGFPHKFAFNESISFIITVETQKEVDYYWNALIADGGQESQCGWLKDKFGVSWQVVPNVLGKLLSDPKTSKKAMEAMLTMRKLDIAKLQAAAKS